MTLRRGPRPRAAPSSCSPSAPASAAPSSSTARLVPNTELGHLELHGHDAEKRASTKAKEDHELSWQHWAHRVQKYLAHVEMLFSPELFVIGGGVSRKADKFLPLIEGIRAEIVPAQLQNNAGIVGAAMAAHAARAGGHLPWTVPAAAGGAGRRPRRRPVRCPRGAAPRSTRRSAGPTPGDDQRPPDEREQRADQRARVEPARLSASAVNRPISRPSNPSPPRWIGSSPTREGDRQRRPARETRSAARTHSAAAACTPAGSSTPYAVGDAAEQQLVQAAEQRQHRQRAETSSRRARARSSRAVRRARPPRTAAAAARRRPRPAGGRAPGPGGAAARRASRRRAGRPGGPEARSREASSGRVSRPPRRGPGAERAPSDAADVPCPVLLHPTNVGRLKWRNPVSDTPFGASLAEFATVAERGRPPGRTTGAAP